MVRIWISAYVEYRCLEVLGLLTKLCYKDERMQESMDIMISKQNNGGKWFTGEYI